MTNHAPVHVIGHGPLFSRLLARSFLLLILTTQFIFIELMGGYLRPYHFLVPLMLILFLPALMRIRPSPTMLALIGLNAVAFGSAAFAISPSAALTSTLLLSLNSSLAIVFAVVLENRRLTHVTASAILAKVTVFACLIGIAQYLFYRTTGVVLGYSESQIAQIRAGFAPSLFNEANTFAKFLVTSTAFFLPVFLRRRLSWKHLAMIGFVAVSFWFNFMRTAFVAIAITFVFAGLWSIYVRQMLKAATRIVPLVAIIVIGMVWATEWGLVTSEYNLYKIAHLVDADVLETDNSWLHRRRSMEMALQLTLSDPFTIVFGNGWGQAYGIVGGGEVVQLGGADIVNVFAYTGVVGALFYIVMIVSAMRAAARGAQLALCETERRFAEGVLFALVGNLALGGISGVILLGPFWLMVGAAMTLGQRRARAVLPRPGMVSPVRGGQGEGAKC